MPLSSTRHRKFASAASSWSSTVFSLHGGSSYTKCLSITFLLLAALAVVISPCQAFDVYDDCVIHRPPSAMGNFTSAYELRKQFDQIKRRCDEANRERDSWAASEPNPSYFKEIIPVVNLGVQLATEGRDSIAQLLPAIDLAIEKVMYMPAFRGVAIHVVPILYLDWLACDSLAVVEKFHRREINVLFGPLNDFVLGAAARFSTALYFVPIVSPAASSVKLSDKHEYGLLTRMYFTYADLEWVFACTLIHFGWKPKVDAPIALITVQPISVADTYNAGWDSFFQKQAVSSVLTDYKPHNYQVERGIEDLKKIFVELPKTARSKLVQPFSIHLNSFYPTFDPLASISIEAI
uniref:ANF_receptor domain-containing protein n=1 Tax=Mesocestoides corti TaxID=53468 RepID=A0A5K3FPK7_MESCO